MKINTSKWRWLWKEWLTLRLYLTDSSPMRISLIKKWTWNINKSQNQIFPKLHKKHTPDSQADKIKTAPNSNPSITHARNSLSMMRTSGKETSLQKQEIFDSTNEQECYHLIGIFLSKKYKNYQVRSIENSNEP